MDKAVQEDLTGLLDPLDESIKIPRNVGVTRPSTWPHIQSDLNTCVGMLSIFILLAFPVAHLPCIDRGIA